jgi:hypothetical protein
VRRDQKTNASFRLVLFAQDGSIPFNADAVPVQAMQSGIGKTLPKPETSSPSLLSLVKKQLFPISSSDAVVCDVQR